MKLNLKIKNKKTSGSAENKDEEQDSNDEDNDFGDALETFLSAIESQSYIEICAPNPNTTTSNLKYNTAELPLQASLRGENPDKQIYNLSLQSERENKFLRFFAKEGMLNFEGGEGHAMGGVLVQRYDDDNCTCMADKNDDAEECSSSNSSAITMYNTRFKVYLSVNEWGMFFGSKEKTPLYVKSLGNLVADVDETVLSEEDKEHFKTQGYVILKNAIPTKYVNAARKNVNWQIGNNGNVDVKKFPVPLRCNIFNHSPILWSALNILLGPGNVPLWQDMWDKDAVGFQLPIRFPNPPYNGEFRPDAYQRLYQRPGPRSWHVDNPKEKCPFNILVGVALSDQLEDGSGCTYVYPGKHTSEELKEYKEKCIGTDREFFENSENKPDMGEAVPVLLGMGDVVLAHASLPHSASANVSGDVRYQIFFRVKHAKFGEVKKDWMEDPMKCFMV